MVTTLTFVADTMTPVRAYAALRRAAGDAMSFLLESVVGGERWGRYSILGYNPRREVTLQPDGRWVGRNGQPADIAAVPGARDPLEAVRSLFDPGAQKLGATHPAARFV